MAPDPSEDNPITDLCRRWLGHQQPQIKTTAPPQQVAPVHQHDMVIIQAKAGQRRPLEDNHTIVVYGCRGCDWVDDQVILGAWTLEELQRRPAASPGPVGGPNAA